jgi:predicted permease
MANLLGAAGVIFVLVGLGFLARKLRLLRAGDERVLNALVYYFALPAFLLLELAQATYSWEILRFVLAGGGPLFCSFSFWGCCVFSGFHGRTFTSFR